MATEERPSSLMPASPVCAGRCHGHLVGGYISVVMCTGRNRGGYLTFGEWRPGVVCCITCFLGVADPRESIPFGTDKRPNQEEVMESALYSVAIGSLLSLISCDPLYDLQENQETGTNERKQGQNISDHCDWPRLAKAKIPALQQFGFSQSRKRIPQRQLHKLSVLIHESGLFR